MNFLKLLSGKTYISGKELGEKLSISRAAVHKRINTLKRNGYAIETSPKGYKLVGKADVFNEKELISRLDNNLKVFSKLLHYKKINSTQDKLKKIALKSVNEGIVVVADEQSAGRGRLQKKWSANKGGLWFSLLLKPSVAPEAVSRVALLVSVVLNKVFEDNYGIKTQIKWPNDVLFNGKKLVGILIEMSAEQDKVNWLAAGIGININNKVAKELEGITSSLGEITGKIIPRAEVLALFLNEFNKAYLKFQKEGFKPFKDFYNKKAAFIGQKIKVSIGTDEFIGISLGIDEDGKLLVKTANGIEKIISATIRPEGK